MASQKPKNPAVAEIDEKIAQLKERVQTILGQLEKLEEQREKLLSVDKLKEGSMVVYTPAKRKESYEARIIAITDEGGKGTWYVLRLNEGTVDETTRKARLSEIQPM